MIYLHDINPIALDLSVIQVHWYGLMYLAAAASAWWLGRRRAPRDPWRGFTPEQIDDLIFYGMLGVVLGGRIGYMLFYQFHSVLANPLSLFKVWEGGMSFHGGLLGVLIVLGWWSRKLGRHPFDLIDFAAPLVPLGLGFGRVGNYIGGELWGRLTDGSWGVLFPKSLPFAAETAELQARLATGELNQYLRHPSQLYQAALEGALLFIVVYAYSRVPRRRYAVSAVFAIVYGLQRIVIEFFREPDADKGFVAFGWLTMGQLLSLPLVLVGVVLWLMSRRQPLPQGK